ncbi:hypothetical protein NKH85_15795 [Mesorhizobium sp. M0924]|uniref:SH3 domain-containing protein n=1 Tax=unclassified Mesorhizobium TaxID=325217 RepID=UPI003338D9D8
MTDSAFDAWQRDPTTRALLDFANSPAMTEAQKLAKVVADLPGSRAFDEAQRLASGYNQALEDVKRLTSAQTLAIDHKLASGYNQALADLKRLTSAQTLAIDHKLANPFNQALEDVKRLISVGGHAITEAQRLRSAFGVLADSPAMRDMRRLADGITGFADSPAVRDMQQLGGVITGFADSPAMRDMQQLAKAAAGFADSPAMREAQKFAGAFSTASDLPTLAALSGLGKAFDHYRRNPSSDFIETFAGTSAGQVLQELIDIQIAKSGNGIVGNAEDGVSQGGSISIDPKVALYEAILDTVNSIESMLKEGKVSRGETFFLTCIFPIIVGLFFYMLSGIDLENEKKDIITHFDESNHQIVYDINEKISAVQESFERLSHRLEQGPPPTYIVVRSAPLNWQRKYSGGYYVWLQPGQRVEVLRRSGKWLEVRTILADHTEIAGWVLKKYLRSLR